MPGDVLVAVDAQPIADGADLAAKIGSMAPGTTVKIENFSQRQRTHRLGDAGRTSRHAVQTRSRTPAAGAVLTWPDPRTCGHD